MLYLRCLVLLGSFWLVLSTFGKLLCLLRSLLCFANFSLRFCGCSGDAVCVCTSYGSLRRAGRCGARCRGGGFAVVRMF